MPYIVAIIIGEEFGGADWLAERMHVWAPRLPQFESLVEKWAAQGREYSNESGMTLYYYEPGEAAEETFLSLLPTVDLHHGEFSHDPPWSALEVHGCRPTESVIAELEEYGVRKIENSADGFIAWRG